LGEVKGDKKNPEYKEFSDVLKDLNTLTNKGDKMMELVIKSDESWFLNTFIKLIR
jgi:hypothetical protein